MYHPQSGWYMIGSLFCKIKRSDPWRRFVDTTFKGCLQRIDISGQILGSEQLSPKNCQENQRLVTPPLERGLESNLSVTLPRRLRIEHVNSSVKRCRIVKDRICLWKADIRDVVMEFCC